VVGLLHLLTFATSAEDQLKNNTIVVQTPLQNYEQPTLRDYEECQQNRDNCINVCDYNKTCEDECPVCPELYDKPLMVQGINDTDIVAPPQAPINTTNIIRLTNEINNIIEHQIQNRNEVNVKVNQNVSQVGGRFGLGYNDHGSCCYVVRLDRECEQVGEVNASIAIPGQTSDEEEEDEVEEVVVPKPPSGPCCNVFAPRICSTQVDQVGYKCFSRSQQQCGSFCSANKVVLAPPNVTTWTKDNNQMVVMPPNWAGQGCLSNGGPCQQAQSKFYYQF